MQLRLHQQARLLTDTTNRHGYDHPSGDRSDGRRHRCARHPDRTLLADKTVDSPTVRNLDTHRVTAGPAAVEPIVVIDSPLLLQVEITQEALDIHDGWFERFATFALPNHRTTNGPT